MPVFTFEKISPPIPDVPSAAKPEKPRGVIVQILDRFVGTRQKPDMPPEKGSPGQ